MVTKIEIEAAKTEKGGWTKEQLRIWGVPWPPEKGWQKKLVSGEIVLPIQKLSKKKRQKMAGQAGVRNKFMMCRIWINAGFPNPYSFKNNEIADKIASHFNLTLGADKAHEIVEWAKITSPDLLKDTRPGTKVKAKRRALPHKQVSNDDFLIVPPPVDIKEAFYKSWDWRTLRMQALKKHGARCQCCGATKDSVDISGNQVRIVVDHIQPLAKRWDLRLDLDNLQILCDECNMGKGAWDRTDWRNV